MRLEDLMERASKFDETLARDIKDYVHGRKYGLMYEASKPEFVRMWKKPVVRGDLVNILPPRGVMEDSKSENDSAEVVYKVIGINGGVAKLRNVETGEEAEAAVDDVVALACFDKPIYAGLKEVDRVERGGEKPYNVVINGENYHALQTLVYAYQGTVDCIYIDPPYNTGASDWKYNNNYVGKDDQYRHSKWLTFMEDRLKLAKKLLNPKDSVLIVTIDEKEYMRLGLLLEQLFPEARIQMVSSVINPKGSARDGFSRSDEYIYFVMIGDCSPERLPLSDDWSSSSAVANSPNKKEKESPEWISMIRYGTDALRSDRPNLFYPIYVNPNTRTIEAIGDIVPSGKNRGNEIDGLIQVLPLRANGQQGRWEVSPEELEKRIKQGRVRVGRKTVYGYVINYLSKEEYQEILDGLFEVEGYATDGSIIAYKRSNSSESLRMPPTQWKISTHNASENGTGLLTAILGTRRFPFPKSLYAVYDTIKFFVSNKPEAVIIDFFAGSGTTLHAVNLLNANDGGNRRCICVTNNEVSADEIESLTKQGLRPGDDEWDKLGIARYITWPRTKCAIEGVDVNGNPLKGDYGCSTEIYEEYEGEVLDPETGKKKRKKLYEKVKKPSYPELADHMMADGFEENAIFFDLEYLEPAVVVADLAYDSIAPILWMCGGCKGEILSRHKGYVVGETYAVLFDPRYTKKFVDVVIDMPEVSTVFIVTDAAERYRSLCAELPGRRVMQLYESYLRSFEINAIG